VIRNTATGVELDVHVIARARKTMVAGIREDALVVRLAEPPVDGRANAALVDFIADALGVSRSAIQLTSGLKSRNKRLRIGNRTSADIRALAR
jgi:uncharacterized protein (TIGR00251 family)